MKRHFQGAARLAAMLLVLGTLLGSTALADPMGAYGGVSTSWSTNTAGYSQVSGYAQVYNYASGRYELQSSVSFSVYLYDGRSQLVGSTVITNGYYMFTNLCADTYTVVMKPSSGAFYGETSYTFTLDLCVCFQVDFFYVPCDQPTITCTPAPYCPPTQAPACYVTDTPCPTPKYEDMTQTGESLPVAPFAGLLLAMAGGVALLLRRRG